MTTSTILSHRGTQIKAVGPRELGGYGEGFRLQVYTERGLGTIECDRDEMRALLRLLPIEALGEVLLERGHMLTLTLDNTPRPADTEPVPARFCPPADPQTPAAAAPGSVCACEAKPGVHLATERCLRRRALPVPTASMGPFVDLRADAPEQLRRQIAPPAPSAGGGA